MNRNTILSTTCGIPTLGLFHTLISNKPEPSFHQSIHLREQLVSLAGPLSQQRSLGSPECVFTKFLS
ncbi:hypothetical protein BU25DRAFT_414855 [Macroventuria anomochaeta]|uniref:Uncharacterized protein n=1 Tax=Macroventuria anomochaeta TaxID=301207 RepID=A0ACB6RNJ0_9PLEO|nr:uncharacterized protein BU25DRAFT_414855 [Macroventuria anomochaeta]KAF2622872.1 hypothetical protein BU25DRAFT_414855 [Macroventuria anomochaeta]